MAATTTAMVGYSHAHTSDYGGSMGQRLIEDTAGVHFRTLLKPRIIGWNGGCPVWSIAGAEGEGSGSGGGSGDTGSQGGTGTGDGAGSGSGGNGGTSGSEGQGGNTGSEGGEGQGNEGSGDGTVSRAEFDRLMARMQAADRNRSQMEQELQQYKDRDKTDLEKAQDEAKNKTTEVESLKGVVKRQAVQLAFLSSASHITWHNPADALEFAMKELSDLEVKEDGTVDAKQVKAAADKLAKDKPYLVKTSNSGGDGGGQQGGGSGGAQGGNGASGAPVGNGSGSNDKVAADRQRLATKYPALRR